MLFKAEGCQRDLENAYNEFVEYSVDQEENISKIVARQLLYSVEEILKRSPQCGRIRRWHVGVFAAGQVDPVVTALNVAQRREEPVVYSAQDRTEDIPENRVITEAIVRAFPMLDIRAQIGLKGIHDRWTRRFLRSRDVSADLEAVERRFAKGWYGGSRDYYRKALMLAQIVLGSSGIGLNEAASIEGDAVLLNTPNVFERYLRNVIAQAYGDAGFVVTKGGAGLTTLYTDGSFELLPDIVISRDGRTLLIADAKYKSPTPGDHYQMVTYMAVNKVKRGALLCPLFEGGEIKVREYATEDKNVVREVFLPLTNLIATEEFLGTVVERFA